MQELKKIDNAYEQQAQDFLKKHGYKFAVRFVKLAKYWDDDKRSRHIYSLSLIRTYGDKKRVSFNFGQSFDGTDKSEKPTAYDLLARIQKNDPGTFEDFCADFGYDTDSRKAEKTYRAVLNEWKKVAAFFNTEALDDLQEIN